MNIFSGFAVLSLVVGVLAVYSSIIFFTTASAYETIDEPFNIPYQYNDMPDTDYQQYNDIPDTDYQQYNDMPDTDYQQYNDMPDTDYQQYNDMPDTESLFFDQLPLTNTKEQKQEYNQYDNKFVILMFDRGYQSIFTTAKPILDKFGFKASIFIACDYIGDEKGMNWNQIRELYNNEYDIQSHGLKHERLNEIKSDEMEFLVSGGKECLEEQGFSPTIFQAPYNKGGDDPQIVNTIGKYFDLAFTGHSELMFLNCDGWENFGYDKENYYGSTDCNPYSSDGTLTTTNKFGMKEWSHDRYHDDVNNEMNNEDPHDPEVSYLLYKKFVEVVNSQTEFNKNGQINAIPIIGYHEISRDDEIGTSPELFELEMEYLYDNGFNVITLADLGYDETQEQFYVKKLNPSPQQPSTLPQNIITQEEIQKQQYDIPQLLPVSYQQNEMNKSQETIEPKIIEQSQEEINELSTSNQKQIQQQQQQYVTPQSSPPSIYENQIDDSQMTEQTQPTVQESSQPVQLSQLDNSQMTEGSQQPNTSQQIQINQEEMIQQQYENLKQLLLTRQ